MRWDDLTMGQKSALMRIYINNGVTSLDDMRSHYNSFAEGGFSSPSYPPFNQIPQRTDISDNEKRARGKWHVENARENQQSIITKAFNEARSRGLTTEQAYEYVADVAKQHGWSKEGSIVGERTIQYKASPNISSSDNNVSQRYFISDPISEEEYQRRKALQAIRQTQQSSKSDIIYDSDEKVKRDNPNNPRTPFEPHPITPKEMEVTLKGLKFLQPFDPTGITGVPDFLNSVASGKGIGMNFVGMLPAIGKVKAVENGSRLARFNNNLVDTGEEVLGNLVSRISPKAGNFINTTTSAVQDITSKPAEEIVKRLMQKRGTHAANRFVTGWNLGATVANFGRAGEDVYDFFTEDPLVQRAKEGFQFAEGGKAKPPYKEWVKKVNPDFVGPDYNLEAAYNALPYETLEAWRLNPNANHLPDTYKRPNHHTFSEESVYSQGPIKGGTWYYEPVRQGQYMPRELLVGGINGVEPSPMYRSFDDGGSPDIPPERFFGIAAQKETDNTLYRPTYGTVLPTVNIVDEKYDPYKNSLIEGVNQANSFYYNDVVPRLNREHKGLSQPTTNFPYINLDDIGFSNRYDFAGYVTPINPTKIYLNPSRNLMFSNPGELLTHENAHRWQFELPHRDKQYREKSIKALRNAYGNYNKKLKSVYGRPLFYDNVIRRMEYEADNRAMRFKIWQNFIDDYDRYPTIEELDSYIDNLSPLDIKIYLDESGYLDTWAPTPDFNDGKDKYERDVEYFEKNIDKIKTALKHVASNNSRQKENISADGGPLNIPSYWGQPTRQPQGPIDYLSRYVRSQAFEDRAPNDRYVRQARGNVDSFNGVQNAQWKENSIGPHINEYNNTVTMYPGRIDTPYAPYEYSFKAPYMAILAHEFGHLIDPNYNKEQNVPKSYMGLYKGIPSNANYHDSRPDEIYADLQSLRYQLYEKHIYDIINDGAFNEKHLDKALKQEIPNRLLYTIPKDTLIQMMNNIADNAQPTQNVADTYVMPTDLGLGTV